MYNYSLVGGGELLLTFSASFSLPWLAMIHKAGGWDEWRLITKTEPLAAAGAGPVPHPGKQRDGLAE